MDNCIFCAIVARRAPAAIVYEDEHTLAFLDIHPSARGHTLVIPKQHYSDLYALPPELDTLLPAAARVARALRSALAPDGLNLMQANGRAAGQSVFHFHFHLIPRWTGDHLPVPRHPAQATGRVELEAIAEQVRQAL